jgi:hypothetical protein
MTARANWTVSGRARCPLAASYLRRANPMSVCTYLLLGGSVAEKGGTEPPFAFVSLRHGLGVNHQRASGDNPHIAGTVARKRNH